MVPNAGKCKQAIFRRDVVRLLCRALTLPLVEAVDRNDAATPLEGMAIRRLGRNAVRAGVDRGRDLAEFGRPTRDESPNEIADSAPAVVVEAAGLIAWRDTFVHKAQPISPRHKMGRMNDDSEPTTGLSEDDQSGAGSLLVLVYDELRKLAASKIAQEGTGHSLQATALVHDAYVRLVESGQSRCWNGRGHFFGAAAEAMRRILVERARERKQLKRGHEHRRVDLEADCMMVDAPLFDVLALDEALSRLATLDSLKADLVKLRYFCGMTMPEAAAALDISLATAERYWTFSKAWLYTEMVDHD